MEKVFTHTHTIHYIQ